MYPSPLRHRPEPDAQRVIRRRNRIPVSCGSCRMRKLKCNRANPCENCVKRGDAETCTYAGQRNPNQRKAVVRPTARSSSSSETASSSPSDIQNRINRLETLVLSLMNNGQPSSSTAEQQGSGAPDAQSKRHVDSMDLNGYGSMQTRGDTSREGSDEAMSTTGDAYESDTEQVTKSLGVMKVVAPENKAYYFSDSHWITVLHDLAEVRNFLHKNKSFFHEHKLRHSSPDRASPNLTNGQLDLVFGARLSLNERDIRESFPSRYIADMMIDGFFALEDPMASCLHVPTFRKQYERHWQNPESSTIVWLAMLFAIFRRVLARWELEGNTPEHFSSKETQKAIVYRDLMIQCLLLADYTTPQRYLIETMLFFFYGDGSEKGDTYIWTLSGLATRLAMRMGYHRDAKTFSSISVFEGEMRRRVWIYIRMSDTFYSHKAGMPVMVRSDGVDSELPRNLHDSDFDEDTKVLPPDRPLSEPTIISYGLVKARVMFAVSRVLEHIQKINGSSYEEVMEIDAELRNARAMIPDYLTPTHPSTFTKMKSLRLAMGISCSYLKGQCILHRRFLTAAHNNPRYAYSRRACVEAALELLNTHKMLYNGLDGDKQYRNPNSILRCNWENTIMAAMLVAIDLLQGQQNLMRRYGRTSNSAGPREYIPTGDDKEQTSINALRDVYGMWYEERDEFIGAWRSVVIIGVLLDKLGLGQMIEGKRVIRDDKGDGVELAPCNPVVDSDAAAPSLVSDAMGERQTTSDAEPQSGQDYESHDFQSNFELQGEKEKAAMALNLMSTGGQLANSSAPNNAVLPPNETAAYGTEASNNHTKSVNDFSAFDVMQSEQEWLNPDTGPPIILDPALAPSAADFVGQMPDMHQFENPDWNAWDSYLQSWTAATQPISMNPLTGLSSEAQINCMPEFATSSSEANHRLYNGNDLR